MVAAAQPLVPAPPFSVEPGTILRARHQYEILQQIRKGGFGSVYLARCLASGDETSTPPAQVAVKFFHPPLGLDPAGSLKRELSALLACKHARIIRLYDWNLELPHAFIVIEYYPQGSLHDYLQHGPLNEGQVWRLLQDLLTALTVAHRDSILHLDIKPGNVLLDGEGGYVLTDFGISQGSLVSRSIVDIGVGSLGYQSPEQRARRDADIGMRTDLWGVGATVWSVFTGLRLDLRPELFLDPRLSATALPPLRHFRQCTPELDELLMPMLRYKPEERPGGAAEVLSQIAALSAPARASWHSTKVRGRLLDQPHEIQQLVESLVDPLWAAFCTHPHSHPHFVTFEKGDYLCRQGEQAYCAYILLKGSVVIELNGKRIAEEYREGSFFGEVSTLTGQPRTASVRAETDVYACVFNAAELEQFVTCNPAIGIRLIKSLALRMARMSAASRDEAQRDARAAASASDPL